MCAESVFSNLSKVNVNDHVEKKYGLSYVSWAYQHGEVLSRYPDATYMVYENKDGWNYHTDGRTCWVKCSATIGGIERIEYLPVMDNRNNSIPLEKVTSFDVNKAIQRCITKAYARHGLGLYIYAGEDLPEEEKNVKEEPKKKAFGITEASNLLVDGRKLGEIYRDDREFFERIAAEGDPNQQVACAMIINYVKKKGEKK